MKNRVLTLATLMMFAAGAACAAPASSNASAVPSAAAHGANFVSGNKNNDGKYTPRKVIRPNDPNRVPGFWDKEWQRSGLDKTIGGAKWSPIASTSKFFKEKEDAYKARHPESVSAAKTK